MIDKNLKLVKHPIAEAAEKAGRDAGSINIIAVRKMVLVEEGATMVRIGTEIFVSRPMN